jgi:NAD(P)-dependent dehydrogenase (short-subunit alcohol dehydrogenase family)
MEKKVILITGATGGLGKEMAVYFSKQNFVHLALHTFQKEPFHLDCYHQWFKADLRDSVQIDSLAQSVISNFGQIDVIIHNAGISINGMSWKLKEKDFSDVLAVNLTAPFLLSRALIPHMRERENGRIVFISSIVAQTGVIGTAAYAASKAGILGLMKTLSKELANKKITCNALALGYFEKGMIEQLSDEEKKAIIQQTPINRLGNVSAILKTLDWLISEEASFVTGQTISLNGGLN